MAIVLKLDTLAGRHVLILLLLLQLNASPIQYSMTWDVLAFFSYFIQAPEQIFLPLT